MQKRFITTYSALFLALLLAAAPARADESVFRHIWGGFSTSFSGRSPQQRHNTALAIRELDGVIIPPGGEFSFNSRVGARERAKGYDSAPMISQSGVLEETPGGGICQLATTIYNAGLLAGLQVVERHPHSRAVAYVPVGRDATIASWRKDLKLRNPFQHPLLLKLSGNDERLTASFRSASLKEFQVEILTESSEVQPDTVIGGQGAARQAGTRGFSSITRRIIRNGATETGEIVSEDSYPAPSRILGGTR